MLVQLAVPLSGEYGVLHHAGAHGNWRTANDRRGGKAHARGGAEILSPSCRAFRVGGAPVRASGARHWTRRRVCRAYRGFARTGAEIPCAENRGGHGFLRPSEFSECARGKSAARYALLHRAAPLL